MKLLFFVLNNANLLDEFLYVLSERGLRGATVLHSTGMARSIYDSGSAMISSLQALFEPATPESRTIFTVVDDAQEKIFKRTIREVVGELSKPNTGILFTLPVESAEGLVKESSD